MLPAERGCRVRRARRRLSEQCPLRRFRLTPSWEKVGAVVTCRETGPRLLKKSRLNSRP